MARKAVNGTRQPCPSHDTTLTTLYPPQLLLDLLEPAHCPAIQSATLLTLVAALVDAPANTRTFEALDGLLAITSLFRSRTTVRDVKIKLVEFLYFYLMPETATPPTPSKLGASSGSGSGGSTGNVLLTYRGRRRTKGGVPHSGAPPFVMTPTDLRCRHD